MGIGKFVFRALFFAVALGTVLTGIAFAEDFKIAIMQDNQGEAQKYQPLLKYLSGKGVDAKFVTASNYTAAAKMFASGDVDAMFSGSGVAATMFIKDIAVPVARPVSVDGKSTYRAVILAPKGSAKFTGDGKYFEGKKVIFTSLASAGEFFYRSMPGVKGVKAELLKAASHGAAIDALSKGKADIAIVKNLVWEKEKSKYQGLEMVGDDRGENPDNTLIVSKKAKSQTVDKVSDALLGLDKDTSAPASAVKESLKIKGFIKTTLEDFRHTLGLVRDAGVDKNFNFAF